jgi:hypothetical protein
MSSSFTLFVLLIWNPLMVLAGGLIVKLFGAQIGKLGFVGFVSGFYVYVLMFFAPGIWHAFGRKGS